MDIETSNNDPKLVDVLSLEGFRATLDGRLSEAVAVCTSLNELLVNPEPKLGDLPDAHHVAQRYKTLYGQAVDRVSRLINALYATRSALDTIIENYQTNEARLTADANDIADALGGVSGVQHHGGSTYAR